LHNEHRQRRRIDTQNLVLNSGGDDNPRIHKQG
jgi:hypothetical protein